MTKEFDEMMNMDPLLEAERITGKDYKEDKATAGLGFLLHLDKQERVRDEMTLRDDTYWSSPYEDAERIIRDLGFEKVYHNVFKDTGYGRNDDVDFTIFWGRNVLLSLESYNSGTGRPLSVNSIHVYGNWKSNDPEKAWPPVGGSGHQTRVTPGYETDPEDPWVFVGSWDGRTGLRNFFSTMEGAGTFLPVWLETPFMYLACYAEKNYRSTKFNYAASTRAKVKTFPKALRDMINSAIPEGKK